MIGVIKSIGKTMIGIILGILMFLIAITACLFSIKTKIDLEKAEKHFMDTLSSMGKKSNEETEVCLSEPVDEATKAVVKDMYPRPLTSKEAEKEVFDNLKYGPMPGSITKRLKCGTTVTKMPFVIEIPEGYEMARLNRETGHFEWSDGTICHTPSEMRKIQ